MERLKDAIMAPKGWPFGRTSDSRLGAAVQGFSEMVLLNLLLLAAVYIALGGQNG